MREYFGAVWLAAALSLSGCDERIDGYLAASSISVDGFARNGEVMNDIGGQEIRLWGYVDHGNLYGDQGAREIMGEWWSGAGPSAAAWRFNLKAGQEVGAILLN